MCENWFQLQILQKNSHNNISELSAPITEFKKEVALLENTANLHNAFFWSNNRDQLPALYRLNIILFNIPATSAHLERFFSVAGHINNSRAQNMSNTLLTRRAMLKVNIKLLDNVKCLWKYSRTYVFAYRVLALPNLHREKKLPTISLPLYFTSLLA